MVLFLAAVVLAGANTPVELTFEPEAVIAGRDQTVKVLVSAPGRMAGELRVDAEGGELGTLRRTGDHFEALWRLPHVKEPRRLAAAVIDLRTGTVVHRTLPVSRRATLRLRAPPGAKVEISNDAGEVIETSTAGPQGRGELSVIVPPAGRVRAVIVDPASGTRRIEEFGARDKLRVWSLFPSRSLGSGDSGPLYVIVYRDSGSAASGAQVTTQAGSSPSQARAVGGGVYAAEVRANGAAGSVVNIKVVARDGTERAQYEVDVPIRITTPLPGIHREQATTAWTAAARTGIVFTADGTVSPSVALRVGRRLLVSNVDHTLSVFFDVGLARLDDREIRLASEVKQIFGTIAGDLIKPDRAEPASSSDPRGADAADGATPPSGDPLPDRPTTPTGATRTDTTATEEIQTTTLVPVGQLQWLIPVSVGARYAWQIDAHWNLAMALSTGPLVQIVEAHGVDVPSRDTYPAMIMAWQVRVGAGLTYRLGPGDVGVHIGASPVVLADSAWFGPSATFEAAAGYAGQF